MSFNVARNRHTWIGLCVISVAVCVAICVLFLKPNRYSIITGRHHLVAHYDKFAFAASYNQITGLRVSVDPETGTLAPNLFLRMQDGQLIHIREISQAWFIRTMPIKEWRTFAESNVFTYFNVRSMAQFKNGKLTVLRTVLDDLPIQFGPTKDGPFVSLPMTRARMIEVFGKPKRWSWSRRRGV